MGGRRSLWKGPFCLVKPGMEMVMSRASMILPDFVGRKFNVHNGNKFVPVRITAEMVGHKFGEFALTRNAGMHKGVAEKLKRAGRR